MSTGAFAKGEKRIFRGAAGVNLETRNYDNLGAPDDWQDDMISVLFRKAITQEENVCDSLGIKFDRQNDIQFFQIV